MKPRGILEFRTSGIGIMRGPGVFDKMVNKNRLSENC